MKKRIGFILPHRNAVIEPEVYKNLPHHVSAHFTRMGGTVESEASLMEMKRDLAQVMQLLVSIKPVLINFCCTSGSFLKGLEWEQEIKEMLEEGTGVKAATATGSVVEALKHCGLKRVALVSPYEDWLNERLVEFLAQSGIEVTNSLGMGLTANISEVEDSQLLELVRAADSKDAEGIFLSCTNLPTAGLLTTLEEDLNKPVISSNSAIIWKSLRAAEIRKPMPGLGRLFLQN